ncbi:hypothetical protein Ddye_012960 [Dipteronia dyeriana]|uniref:Uncharacterized protein n=1 Tax=Dipteronia dyeriana TaxID=168575 RepID=A0AAD9X5B3_9ROSI|nr:hypothetical protein Ddye_012960 [Dipteronia dyeriana]
MEDFRSKSCKVEAFNGGKAPTSMQDLRCYSATNYYNNYYYQVGGDHHHHQNSNNNNNNKEMMKMKKSKSSNLGKISTFGKSTSTKSWSFNDAELQRKSRVASYKVYAVEGKMKGSLRKSFKWIKNTCNQMINGL